MPLSYDIFPEKTLWDNIKDGFSTISDKASQWFKNITSRRLLGTHTYSVELKASTTGAPLVTNGNTSGIAVTEASGMILAISTLLSLLLC